MPASVKEDLIAGAATWPGREAVADSRRRITYAELWRCAAGLAAGLASCGVRRGDRVAIVMRNSVECAIAVYGTVVAGGCFVVLDVTTPEHRLAALLAKTGAKAVVCDESAVGRVRAAAAGVDHLAVVVNGTPGSAERSMAELVEGQPFGGPSVISTDLAAIVFTSGSTGDPRGATFLHRNLAFVTSSVLGYLPLSQADRTLSVLPLSHTYGLSQLLMSVRLGAALHLRPGAGPIGSLLRDLRQQAITVLPGVPTLWQLFRPSEEAVDPLPDVRVLTNAGAALPVSRVNDLCGVFPSATLYAMYGQTECGRISFLPPDLLASRPDSVGVAIPGTQVWLEDELGREPPTGELGELVVRGDHVMQGYWADPEATAGKLVAGTWPGDRRLRTGDLFRRDRDGFLYFVARQDDVITTGGEKVAPLEVERVLCEAPGVAEAVVVGATDAILGQVVVAHVVPGPGAELDLHALRRHCRDRLEGSKVPRSLVVHQALPRLSSGKVDRVRLVDVDSHVAVPTA
ncbi:MAG: AMP-dependent synthetase and ligase [Frankiales bacterium]|nr:AMP-dependent synthetase and ligase [Frankiales bacterium]